MKQHGDAAKLTESTEETASIEKGNVKVLPVSNESPAPQKAAQAECNHAAAKKDKHAGSLACVTLCRPESKNERHRSEKDAV
jgi:hypothetical protein